MTRAVALTRSLLALAILVALAALAWMWIVAPIIARFQSYDQQIAETTEMISRYRRAAAEGRELEPLLADRGASAGELLLRGTSAEMIAADLQRKVSDLVSRHDGRLKTVQVLLPDANERLSRIAIRVAAQVDMRGSLEIFHAIESAVPFLFIDTVTVSGPRILRQPRRAGDAVQPVSLPDVADDMLQVSVEVYGFAEGLDP